nr:hypothetical protein Iba_chr12bCG14970 [Ipomoea batatas]
MGVAMDIPAASFSYLSSLFFSAAAGLRSVTGGKGECLPHSSLPFPSRRRQQAVIDDEPERCSGGGWRCILLRYGAKVAAMARVFSFRWAAMATTCNHSRPPSSPPSSFPDVPLEPIHDGASFCAWGSSSGF